MGKIVLVLDVKVWDDFMLLEELAKVLGFDVEFVNNSCKQFRLSVMNL